MSDYKRKFTKRQLQDRLEDAVGFAKSAMHDRNPNRAAQVDGALSDAANLCIAIRCFPEYLPPPVRDWNKLI